MSFIIIAAQSKNGVIGKNNDIPWHLPADLKHFADITRGKTVLMGRKTFESIVNRLGHPLPDRDNVILTRQKDFDVPGCTVIHTWDEAVNLAKKKDVFVCGGAEIYNLAIPYADKMFLTVVDTEIEGDAHMPNYNKTEWELVREEKHEKDEKNPYDYVFYEYKNTKPINFLDFTHARTPEQIALMQQIKEDGVCPFCPEYFKKYHPKPILKETDWWLVSENMSPYEGTRVHLLFVYKKHATMPNQLEPEAMPDLLGLINWAIKEYDVVGGSFFVRFGDTRYTGGSVDHFHVQFLTGTAKSDDEEKDKLKVKLGYKKPEA